MECPRMASKSRGYVQNVLNYTDVGITPHNAAAHLKNTHLLPEEYFRVTICRVLQ